MQGLSSWSRGSNARALNQSKKGSPTATLLQSPKRLSRDRAHRNPFLRRTSDTRKSLHVHSAKARKLSVMASETKAQSVLVTGAGGKTGRLVFKALKEKSETFKPFGLVRSEKSAKNLSQANEDEIVLGDVAKKDSLLQAMRGKDAVVIVTSAVPKINYLSLVPVLFKKLIRNPNPGMPSFSFESNGEPEKVDWMGQKNQIDAAKEAGVSKVVLVSSMGGTQTDNMLNKIGNGNILLWKRKAEEYLVRSGIDYTIIHPGGLQDTPGNERELVVGVDDSLLSSQTRSISREDVARVCVEALTSPAFKNKSFDIASKKKGDGNPTLSVEPLVKSLPAYDYSINSQLDKEGVSA